MCAVYDIRAKVTFSDAVERGAGEQTPGDLFLEHRVALFNDTVAYFCNVALVTGKPRVVRYSAASGRVKNVSVINPPMLMEATLRTAYFRGEIV